MCYVLVPSLVTGVDCGFCEYHMHLFYCCLCCLWACKSWVVSCWHGYLQSADDYTWSSWCFVKIQNGLPIWWQLTRLSWKKRLLTDCCCCYCCSYCCYLPAWVVAKYCDEHVLSVCLSVCMRGYLSVCEAISRTTHAIFTNFSVHVAYGCGSVLLRQGNEIPKGRGSFGWFSSTLTMHCTA